MSYSLTSRRSASQASALLILLLTGCVSDETIQTIRTDLSKLGSELAALKTQVHTDISLTQRVDETASALTDLNVRASTLRDDLRRQDADSTHTINELRATLTEASTRLAQLETALSRTDTTVAQTAASLTERLTQAQHSQTDLVLTLQRLANDLRTLTGRADVTDHTLQQVQAQLTESKERINRLEFSATQSAILAKEASAASQLATKSVNTSLQNMAEQINTAIEWIQRSTPGQATQPSAPIPPSANTPQQSPNNSTITPPAPKSKAPEPSHKATPENHSRRPATEAHPASATQPADPHDPYRRGLAAYAHDQFTEAMADFQAVLAQSPPHPLSHQARYWLGEAYYHTQRYPEAIQSFAFFLSAPTPDSKAPAALLQTARAMKAAGYKDVNDQLSLLIERYPHSPEAIMARQLMTDQ